MSSRKKTKGVRGGKQWWRTSWFSSWSRNRGAKSTQVEEYSTRSCCYLFFCSPFALSCIRCGRKELLKIVELWHDVRLPRKKRKRRSKKLRNFSLRIWSCSSIKEFSEFYHTLACFVFLIYVLHPFTLFRYVNKRAPLWRTFCFMWIPFALLGE